LADGLRERQAHVVVLGHGDAVVVVYGFDPYRHAQAAGRSHLRGDEATPLPAQQGEHLGAIVTVRKEVVVRKLQYGARMEILQLVNLPFEHVQRLGAERSPEAASSRPAADPEAASSRPAADPEAASSRPAADHVA
jgi:hypothetical protein